MWQSQSTQGVYEKIIKIWHVWHTEDVYCAFFSLHLSIYTVLKLFVIRDKNSVLNNNIMYIYRISAMICCIIM